MCLRGDGFFFFNFFGDSVAACLEGFFMAFRAASSALSASDNINFDAAPVFAAKCANAVILAQGTALTDQDARRAQAVMTTALGGLGSVSTHSYYHNRGKYSKTGAFWQ